MCGVESSVVIGNVKGELQLRVYECYKSFQEVHEDIEGDASSGSLSTVINDENLKIIK